MPTQAPSLPKPQSPGAMPPFISANPAALEAQAVAQDTQAYGLSDADFRQRYPQLYNTQQTVLNNLQSQMTGNLTPQLQSAMIRGGLTGAMTGGTGAWSMGPGTAGMANVARQFGQNQMTYQQNLLNQFQSANDTFRPRTFGLSGADAAQVALSNIAGQNTWNASQYAYNVQNAQFATNLAAQQAVASANAANAQTGNILGAGGSAVSALAVVAFACWVARSVYGVHNPRWKRFRYWMLTSSPAWFRKVYLRYGPTAAQCLERHHALKPFVRGLMELATWRFNYATLPI